MPDRTTPTRVSPTRVSIDVKGGTGAIVTWADGHESRYAFAYLRDRCPCATCRGGHTATARAANRLLPVYKPPARAIRAEAVGNYAVQIAFDDGHSTGIYSFDYLREICPCDLCVRAS